jgi:Na+-driven multidrug efflux pump
MISVVTLSIKLAELTRGQSSRPDFKRLFEKRRLIAGHHWLNISISMPRLVLPILVATIVSAEANAAYTAAMLIISFVNVIPTHLGTVLFALRPGDEVALRKEVKKTMGISLVLAAVTAPFFFVFSNFILSIFGPSYTAASTALAILGLTTYPVAVKVHFVAISRVRSRMTQAGFSTIIGACFEVGLAAVGAALHGVTGVAVGFLSAVLIEVAIYGPVVFRVLRSPPGPGPDLPVELPSDDAGT